MFLLITVPRYKFIKRQAFYSIVIVPLSRLHLASFYVFSKRTRAPGTRSLLRSDWQLRCPLSYYTPSFLLSSKLFFILLSVFPLSVIRQLFFLNYRHKKIRVLKLLFFCKFALNNIIIIKKVLKFI